VAASGGDVAQRLDVDVDQRPGLVVLVAADRLADGPVQIAQAADSAADQGGVDGGGGLADMEGNLGWSQSLGPA
jgi:hypothetical protein